MAPSPPPAVADHANPRTTSTPPPDGVTQIPGQERVQQFSGLPSESSTVPRTLLIGTRASALALAQVELFTSLLSPIHPNLPTKTVPISVAGDRDKITNLHTLAQTGKSLWTEELEVLLLKEEIDCIVHSLKDVPTKVCEGCVVKIVGDRGERRDCVVFPSRETSVAQSGGERTVSGEETSARLQQEPDLSETATTEPSDSTLDGDQPSSKKRKLSPASTITAMPPPKRLSDLPLNSIVGTSSVRRSAMIRRRYPHLRIQDVRGNVGTRLRKLDDPANGFDCLILAGAGVQRLGLGGRVNEWLDPTVNSDEEAEGTDGANGEEGSSKFLRKGGMLHAVGQGAIGLEIREGDGWVSGLLEGKEGSRGLVVNRVSWECQAERSLLRTLEGGCSVPVGVSCSWEEVVNTRSAVSLDSTSETNRNSSETSERTANVIPGTNDPPSHTHTAPLPLPPRSDVQMSAGTLHIDASVTSVDGTECVSASRRQYVSNDQEADEAGWEVARCLVEGGAGKILEAIGLNRGMIERAGGA
ncbi:MAG: hypothetical protein L6R37_001827 [Teloschistes peruensis]|nr:MAG: hypothetical protein L6R37_001827 [Teloschistes peruensis]